MAQFCEAEMRHYRWRRASSEDRDAGRVLGCCPIRMLELEAWLLDSEISWLWTYAWDPKPLPVLDGTQCYV